MIDYYLVADFFYGDFTGGAELNDFSLIDRFKEKGILVKKLYCRDITVKLLEENRHAKFIIANFITLPEEYKKYFIENLDYVIYEHDHKYLKTRNPIFYKDFIAPKDELANQEFFAGAKAIICLTQLAVDVLKANTGLPNVPKIGASVWRQEDLEYINTLAMKPKNGKYAVMESSNPIKKTALCVKYCETNNIDYDLVSDSNHREFLKKLSSYEGIVFMTGHLETCCRLLVEAKMLNCEVITQKKLIGAASEDWFSLSGADLTREIEAISAQAPDVFISHLS